MVRYVVLLMNFLVVLFLSGIPDQEIGVSLQIPDQVQGGSNFEVKLTISKGDLESFSRFTQQIPYGLKARRVSSANADFTFEDQRVRLIWLKLPPEPQVTVTYEISVNKRLKGIFRLDGEFSYIDENERKTIEVKGGHEITIIPDPSVPDSLLTDVGSFGEGVPAWLREESKKEQLSVVRTDPVKTGPHEYTVDLRISKDGLDKFAKIEEYLPEGFRAVEGDAKGGIFSFSQGTAKFLWMNLPPESEFTVSYKIIPDPGKTIKELNISGSFSYISGNQSKTLAVTQKNSNLADITNRKKDTTLSEKRPDVSQKLPEKNTAEPDRGFEVPTGEVIPAKAEESDLLQPEAGIYYRVQLAAGHHKINIDKYFEKRKVDDPVRMEFHEGWRKYTAGSFDIYHDARDYRVKIWNTTPIDDAFVSAYNNGKRITVQEALMISGQKWYQ